MADINKKYLEIKKILFGTEISIGEASQILQALQQELANIKIKHEEE